MIWARAYLNTPTDVFVVTEDWYTTRQEHLRALLKAYKRGTQWMLEKPEEAAQLAVKHVLDGKDPKRNLEIIKIRNAASVNEDTKTHGLGWFDIELLEKVERTFRELGLINTRMEMRRLVTNDLVRTL